jgi:hypothetical protein
MWAGETCTPNGVQGNREMDITYHTMNTPQKYIIKLKKDNNITMPSKYATKKKAKTRSRRRRKRNRRTRMSMPLGGFPNSKIVKLRYVQQSTLDAGSNGYSKQTFLANGLNYIYQPSSGSPVRNDPANFLRNMDSYETYCVLGARMKATFITDGTSNLQPSYCGIYLGRSSADIDNILVNGITKLFEQPRNVRFRRVFGPSQSSNGMTIAMNYSSSKFFQTTPSNYRDSKEYQGNASTDPSDPNAAYFQVFSHAVNGNNPGKCVVIIQIDYIVRLTDTTVSGN